MLFFSEFSMGFSLAWYSTLRVIRNKQCDDVVGCQVTVPLFQSQKAIEDRNCPDNVTCRQWTENRNNQRSNTVAVSLTGIN